MGWTVLIGLDDNVIGYAGDEPWDIIGAAMDKLVKVYQERYGRPPNVDELMQILNFVLPDELRKYEISVTQP